MNNSRKQYHSPTLRDMDLMSNALLVPSAHNSIGDDDELTRRQEWWDEEDEDEQETGDTFPQRFS